MRKLGTSSILLRTEGPGKGLTGPSSHKGQLLVDPDTGRYFRSLSAGPDAEWEDLDLGSISALDLLSDPDFQQALNATIGSVGDIRRGLTVAPPSTGNAATDTAMLQGLIDAASDGDVIELRPSRYQLNAALVIGKDLTLRGQWVRETPTSKSVSLPDIPKASPHIVGSVLVQTTAATDIIQITGGVSAHLQTLGLVFEGAHRFTNTGHGVNVIPATDGTDGYLNGISDAKWRNLKVFGHDGNHYAYRLVNTMHCVFEDLRSWGGGVMHVAAIGTHFNYGNAVFIAPYGYMFCGGTAHAYYLSAEAATGNGALNFLTFIRPQCNSVQDLSLSAAVPLVTQSMWREDNASSTTQVRDIAVVNPDLEASAGVGQPAIFGTYTSVVGAGYLPASATYWQRMRYSRFSAPTLSVNTVNTTGAGSGATATLTGSNAADSQAGVVQLTPGTTPGALVRLLTVNLTANLRGSPKFVQLTYLGGLSDPGFYAANTAAGSFEIRARVAPVAGSAYSIGWRIIE